MRVTVTGATGLIGSRLVAALQARGDEVTVLSRDPARARRRLGGVEAVAWDAEREPAPGAALEGRDGVVHLAGAPIAQRWNARVKDEIERSRRLGTENLVKGLAALQPDARPGALVSASGSGYYGPRGDEPVDESARPGDDFVARVCVVWEAEAERAESLGLRVARVRTGVVLDGSGGALGKMLLPFRLGVGGPVAGGRQYLPWIHADDVVGVYLAALDSADFSGPVNACSPETVTNGEFSKALGRVLRRPAFAPVPGFALRILYGEMAVIVTTGQRMVPGRLDELGHALRFTDVEAALRDALGKA